ncbi:MAG: AAA family ATPase [Thermodesulfobacteriota bacterium]
MFEIKELFSTVPFCYSPSPGTDIVANIPDQKEIEKEIGEYLSKKYGGKVQIISSDVLSSPEKKGGKEKRITDKEDTDFYFDMKPEELIAYLDDYVIQQDEAKAILATKICTHFNRINQEIKGKFSQPAAGRIKSNVLLIGPTGVGKTYLIKLIAQYLGVPFVKGDATKFSETGYVGGDVEDLVRDLVRNADGDIKKAEYGIIYVDEIDKIAASPNRYGADVSRTGVQRAFLKSMEETEVEMKVPHDPISQMEAIEHYRATGKRAQKRVNTRNILFIMSGAFTSLEETIGKRVQQRSIGFEQDVASPRRDYQLFKNVKSQDLLEYGFESEFVGRLPVIAVLNELSEDDFFEILISPNSSVIVSKKQDFNAYTIKLQFEEDALREIASRAVTEGTGARGLVSIIEEVLLHYERKLPSTSIRHFVLTREMVRDPIGELNRLLNDKKMLKEQKKRYSALVKEEVKRFISFIESKQKYHFNKHGLVLNRKRSRLIASICQEEISEPRKVCLDIIERIEHIQQYAEAMTKEYGIDVSFDAAAVDRIILEEPQSMETVDSRCENIMSACEYGLRLLSQKNWVDKIVIGEEGVDSPSGFMTGFINELFKFD